MNPQTKRDAEQLINYLGLPSAIARKGATWCETEQLILAINLGTLNTPQEAQERLVNEISIIKTVLGAKS